MDVDGIDVGSRRVRNYSQIEYGRIIECDNKNKYQSLMVYIKDYVLTFLWFGLFCLTIFNKINFFRKVLYLQKNWGNNTEFPSTHTQFSLLLTSYVGKAHLLHFMNQYGYIVINQSLHFLDFLSFSLMSFFCSRIPSHLVTMSPWSPLGCNSFSDFLCFDDLDSFEVY